MKNLLKQLNYRPIAYFPVYKKITGSTTAGILLSQFLYWFSKTDEFYKTDKDIMDETLLTEGELRTAKNLIKNVDFVTVTRKGIPATTWYKIDWKKYQACLNKMAEQEATNRLNTTSHNDKTINIDYIKTTADKKNKQKKAGEFLPSELNTEAFEMWIEYKGKSYSKQGRILAINKLIKYPKDIQLQMVENSIMNNYKGLYEIKPQNNQAQQTIDPFELYTSYRNKGMDKKVATVRVIQETGMKYPATDDFKEAVSNVEYKIYMRQREAQQQHQQIPMSDEEYQQKLLKEWQNDE